MRKRVRRARRGLVAALGTLVFLFVACDQLNEPSANSTNLNPQATATTAEVLPTATAALNQAETTPPAPDSTMEAPFSLRDHLIELEVISSEAQTETIAWAGGTVQLIRVTQLVGDDGLLKDVDEFAGYEGYVAVAYVAPPIEAQSQDQFVAVPLMAGEHFIVDQQTGEYLIVNEDGEVVRKYNSISRAFVPVEREVEVNIPQEIIDYAHNRGLEVQALSEDEFRLYYEDKTGDWIQIADYRAYDNAADKLTISVDTGEGEVKQELLVDYKFDWYTNGDETYLRGYGRDAHRYRFDKDRGVWIYGAETVEMPTEYGVITINNETEIPFDEIDPEAANIAHRAALFALGVGEPEWPEMRQIVDTFIRNNGITRSTQEKVAGADELVEQVVQMVLERIAENNNLYHIKFPNEYKYGESAQGKQDRQIMGFGDYVLDPTSVVITLLDPHTAVATNKIKGTYQWVTLVSDVDAGVAVNFDNGKLNIVIITDVHNDNRYNSALAAALNLLSWRAGVFGAFPEDVLTTEKHLLNDDMWMSATGNQGFSSRPNVPTIFGFDIDFLKPQN